MYKCNKCNHELIWQNDFMYEDYGIEDDEGIVSCYYCHECDFLYEFFIDLDNKIENIIVTHLEDDE